MKRCSENMQQIYRRTPMLKCDFIKFALQLYLNHTSTRVFSRKFAVYFQNTFSQEHFSQEHLWMAASEYLKYIWASWLPCRCNLLFLEFKNYILTVELPTNNADSSMKWDSMALGFSYNIICFHLKRKHKEKSRLADFTNKTTLTQGYTEKGN